MNDLINGGGTTYAVYLWQDGDPVPGAPVANFTKGVDSEPFSYTATLTVNDGPNIAGNAAPYNVHRFWNWRVDVSNGSGTTTGDVSAVPRAARSAHEQLDRRERLLQVQVGSKSADYTSGVATEGIYILDPNNPNPLAQGWYSGTTTTDRTRI